MTLLRLCDVHNIPMATNIATAEVLIHGLERGDLDWRDIVHRGRPRTTEARSGFIHGNKRHRRSGAFLRPGTREL